MTNGNATAIAEKAKLQLMKGPGEDPHLPMPLEALQAGATLMRAQTNFVTAMQIARPRNLESVIRRCEEEAAIAGDDFYYSWSQGGEVIEGLSVGAALAIVRNYGNAAVDVQVNETPFVYYFTATFIDLETGFNLNRTFRQNKQSPKKKSGDDIYKGERGVDIIFQIGQSKAIRNVVLNAVPSWLSKKVMMVAKQNVVEKIRQMGPEKAKAMITRKAAAIGIATERIEAVYGKQHSWEIEEIVKISSALRAIEDGQERPEDLFPAPKTEGEAPQAKAEGQSPAGAAEGLPEAPGAPEMSPAAVNSAKRRADLLAMVLSSKTEKSLDEIDQKRADMAATGDLLAEDNAEIGSAIGKKREQLRARDKAKP